MSAEEYNLGEDLRTVADKEIAEGVGGKDGKSKASLLFADLKLERENVRLELEKIRLKQEGERLKRLQKNSARRPLFFWGLICVIVASYVGFFVLIFGPGASGSLSDAEGRLRAIELFLLGVIPTVLVALVMKAIFSATGKTENGSPEVKVSDALPVKLISETLPKNSSG